MLALRSLMMVLLLIGAGAGLSAAAFACSCDEICHPGEVYSDAHEMCVYEAIVTDEATEKPTS